jgi:uncharacterized metal-binding protein
MQDVIEKAREHYKDPTTREFAKQSSIQEAECYGGRGSEPYITHPLKPRVQEICEFAQKMGYKRLGIAFCSGLHREAHLLETVLEHHGFEVASVVCKSGCTPKEYVGVEDENKICPGQFEAMCSPITQAELLNAAETDFNVVVGLCVGHDSLFFKYSEAPVTVLVAKDRVMGHNPVAALYTLHSYSERFVRGEAE